MKILVIHQFFLEKGDGGGSRFNEMTQVWGKMGHSVTVLAGMVNLEKLIEIETTKKFEDSSLSKILQMVQLYNGI